MIEMNLSLNFLYLNGLKRTQKGLGLAIKDGTKVIVEGRKWAQQDL
jgi:hypothetical protein